MVFYLINTWPFKHFRQTAMLPDKPYELKIERQELCRLSVLSSTSAATGAHATHTLGLAIRPCGLLKKNGELSPDGKESAINSVDALPWPFTHSILCWFHYDFCDSISRVAESLFALMIDGQMSDMPGGGGLLLHRPPSCLLRPGHAPP